jgi:hypothetical protein
MAVAAILGEQSKAGADVLWESHADLISFWANGTRLTGGNRTWIALLAGGAGWLIFSAADSAAGGVCGCVAMTARSGAAECSEMG